MSSTNKKLSLRYLLILSVVCTSTIFCFAQNNSLPATSAAAYPKIKILAPSETSDTDAVHMCRHAVELSGGMATWTALRVVKTRFNIEMPDKSASRQLLMLDDWAGEKTMYRRGVIGIKRAPQDHNGADTFNVKNGNTNKIVPEFDQARVLADHLPAAALEVTLRRKEYIVKRSNPMECNFTAQCVDVFRKAPGAGFYVLEGRWHFNSNTGLPDSAQILLPNLMNTHTTIWETTTYQSFTQTDGLVVPSLITIASGGGFKQTLSLATISPNVAYDTAHFDKELGNE